MSDSNTSVVSNIAAPVTLDPAKPALATPPPAPSSGAEPNEKPSWLDGRLERERRAVLRDLGLDSVDDAKKAIAELNAKREAEKTAAQKASEAEAALKATRAQNEELSKALGTYAKSKLASLSETQRAAVIAVAGDDAAKQLSMIEALAPTWATSAAQPASLPLPTKPADTAPAPSAPKDGGHAPPSDPKAVYAELRKTNPVIAARYAEAHGLHD